MIAQNVPSPNVHMHVRHARARTHVRRCGVAHCSVVKLRPRLSIVCRMLKSSRDVANPEKLINEILH